MLNQTLCGDALQLLPRVPDGSVDLVLCDLPYGMTTNDWDTLLPMDRLWTEYRRVLRKGGENSGGVILSAIQPFASLLVSSNLRWFKHELVWLKSNISGYLNAHQRPMRAHESILVFAPGKITYHPQGLREINKARKEKKLSTNYKCTARTYVQRYTGYPKTVLAFPSERGLHPTQKPVALFEYLIRTYTRPGEVVLDHCCGSGTTGVAARRAGRQFIQIEKNPEYVRIAQDRLRKET